MRGNSIQTKAGERRSARVLVDVPVVIRGESPDEQPFKRKRSP